MITQLNPAIPLKTPKGDGFAHFLIDYSQEHHLYWVVFINETGECWTFANPEIRIQTNYTLGRNTLSSNHTNHPPDKDLHINHFKNLGINNHI